MTVKVAGTILDIQPKTKVRSNTSCEDWKRLHIQSKLNRQVAKRKRGKRNFLLILKKADMKCYNNFYHQIFAFSYGRLIVCKEQIIYLQGKGATPPYNCLNDS